MEAGVNLHIHLDRRRTICLYNTGSDSYRLLGTCLTGLCSHGSGTLGSSSLLLTRLVIVTGQRGGAVDHIEPTSGLGEEDLLAILLEPGTPLGRCLERAERIAVQDALCALHLLALFEAPDGSLQEADIARRNLPSLGILVNLHIVRTLAPVKVGRVLLVVGDVGLQILTQSNVGKFVVAFEVVGKGHRLRRLEVEVIALLGRELLAACLLGLDLGLLLQTLLVGRHRPTDTRLIRLHRRHVDQLLDILACSDAVVVFTNQRGLALELGYVAHSVGKDCLRLLGHKGGRGSKAPMQVVTVTADCHGVNRLGTDTARNELRIGSIQETPRTRHHTYGEALVGLVALGLYAPHHHRIGHIGREIDIMLGILRCGLLFERNIGFEGALKDRMVEHHTMCLGIETQAVPIELRTDTAADILTLLADRHDCTREILGQTLCRDHLHHLALGIAHQLTGAHSWDQAVNNRHIVALRHSRSVILALHGSHRIKSLLEHRLPGGRTLQSRSLHALLRTMRAKGLKFGSTADVEHLQRSLAVCIQQAG